jgi:plastocyanin
MSMVMTGAAWGYDGGDVSNGGTVSGAVKLRGDAPASRKLEVTKDQEVCGKDGKVSQELVVSPDKGIRYAVVSLTDIKKGKKAAGAAVELNQQGCSFQPHVVVVPAGGTLDILNNDGILHNFHTHSTLNPSINKAQPKFKKKMSEKFEKPEIVKVSCDAHAWMSGWIVVAAHPYYAVTDESGAFKLENVPPGTYTLEVWQESLGKVAREVTVKPREETKLTIELSKK